MSRESGFTLLELVIAIFLFGLGLSIILPSFMTARDHAVLEVSMWQIVSDLRTQQMQAEKDQMYQEVRFPLTGNIYYLYNGASGLFTGRKIEPPISYYEGIIHLPQPTIRFNVLGNVNESGQIIIKDPEGAIRNTIIYMQYGDMKVTTNPLMN